MDALYIVNLKAKEVLLAKEFNDNENNLKMQIFLSEIENILKEETSPIINISNSIFIYKELNSLQKRIGNEESYIMLVALVNQDVNNSILKLDIDKFII